MPGLEEVDVEVSIGLGSAPSLLGVFLYHPNEDGRVEAETKAFAAGAEYVTYPVGLMPPLLDKAYVLVRGTSTYVSIGSMYIIAPLLAKREEIEHLKEAVVYFTTQPFTGITPDEKVWLAARMPLVVQPEENV